jgi:Ca2+-binding EF-hand superfamily protein
MLNPKFLAAASMALGIASGPALAQDAMRADADIQFRQLDKDQKGFLTRADVSSTPAIAQRFAKFDANKDGKLDRSEFTALIASMK